MEKLGFVDLFGAPGGMSLGFKMAGMQPLAALDIFSSGVQTYRRNFPGVRPENVMCADASADDVVEKFRLTTRLGQGDVDVIIGGPPCQGFSIVGRPKIASLVKNGQRHGDADAKFIDDERNDLYKSFIKFVESFQPRITVMENVPGMLSYKDGDVVRQVCNDFQSIGYGAVDYMVLNAADYGVPQTRKRIFFIAAKEKTNITWPAQTHFHNGGLDGSLFPALQKHVAVMDAIGDLPRISLPEKNVKKTDSRRKYRHDPTCEFQEWARGDADRVHNNITRWHRQKDIDVFNNMAPGSKWSNLSYSDRRKIGYSNDSFNDKWKRLPLDRPSWTVVSHLSKDGYMYIHPTQRRTISVREAARLQSFPDSFVFSGSRSAQFRQIGNAVPPLLAMAIARHLKGVLAGG